MVRSGVIGLIIVCAAGIGTAECSSGHAYQTGASRWDHVCLTHDAELSEAFAQWVAVSGVRDCGVASPADIRVAGKLFDPTLAGGAATFLKAPGIIDHCEIAFAPNYRDSAAVKLHEVGHCLGLGHSADPAAVMWEVNSAAKVRLTADDVAGAVAIWGPPVRLYHATVSVARE